MAGMRRRRYLGVLAAAAVAGCGGTPTKSVGESATHDGVEATVPDYIIAEEVTTYSNQKVREGDIGLLVRSTVENVGEEPRPFPNPIDDTIRAEIDDDRVGNIVPRSSVTVNGQNYTTTSHLQYDVRDGAPLEPGESVDAWTLFAAPSDLTATQAGVLMDIGSSDNQKTFEWQLE